jgi:hypothetical protein
VDIVDPPREPSQRVDVGWYDKLIEVLTALGEQADVEPAPTQV